MFLFGQNYNANTDIKLVFTAKSGINVSVLGSGPIAGKVSDYITPINFYHVVENDITYYDCRGTL